MLKLQVGNGDYKVIKVKNTKNSSIYFENKFRYRRIAFSWTTMSQTFRE